MSVESVEFTARCPSCPGYARWCGIPATTGGGTTYKIWCLACADTPDLEIKQPLGGVESVTAPRPIPEYFTRLLGRRAS